MLEVRADIRFVRAEEAQLGVINALIARSKAHWAWPEGYLEKALALLKVTPAYLQKNTCYAALDGDGTVVGFVALEAEEGGALLDHLWLAPDWIGRGLGRRACEHILDLAQRQRWRQVRVLPDPPSEGFYLKMGFSDTGERVPSRVPAGPTFSVFRISVAN